MEFFSVFDGNFSGKSYHARTLDTWRDPKIITPPQLPVITSHFGLKTARLIIADSIYLTILQKRENRFDRLSPDNIKMQVA